MSGKEVEVWPVEFLQEGRLSIQDQNDTLPALIILNQPIADIEILSRIWNHTDYRVCADGGANQLYDLFVDQLELRNSYLPSIVHGDLDSLRDDVRQYYYEAGIQILEDPDQYSTDFGKAIKQITKQQPSIRDILVLGTIAGRVDQGIGLLHEFYREQHKERSSDRPNVRLWLFSESSISFILNPGATTIHTPLSEGTITQNIGILPVYGPAIITTQGLEWDVQDWPTQMGGQVSTSNHIVCDQIVITTNAEVLFTVERNCKKTG